MAAPFAESKSPSVALGGSAGAQRHHAWRHVEQGGIVTRMSCAQWGFRMPPTPPGTPPWPRRGYRPPRRSLRWHRGVALTQGLTMASGTTPATIVRELFEDERGLIELREVVDRINVHFKFFHACQSVHNSRLGFLQAGRTEKC